MTAVMFESDTKTNTAPAWLSWSKTITPEASPVHPPRHES
jgi:hypothetical protein